MQHIATIQSLVVTKYKGPIILEDGYHELEVHVDMELAQASGAPKDYINKEIAGHIMSCVVSTSIPLGEGVWSVEFTQWAQTHLEYGAGFIV